jgi:hypothetical protein
VPALVERNRGQAARDGGAGEIVVVLLARAGAVKDDHAPAGRTVTGGRQPERVGEPTMLARLRWEHRSHHIVWRL